MKEIKAYISNDGKLHETKELCINHEVQQLRNKLQDNANKLGTVTSEAWK